MELEGEATKLDSTGDDDGDAKPDAADANLVDKAPILPTNEPHNQSGNVQHSTHDNTLTLPTDAGMVDDSKPTSHAVSNGDANDQKTEGEVDGIKSTSAPEKIGNFEDAHAHNQQEFVTPLPPKKYIKFSTSLPLQNHSSGKAKYESSTKSKSAWTDIEMGEANGAGTPEEREAFMKELENFHRENALDFKPPKFYIEPLNCLKLWRSVIKLGGYDVVTATKLWRRVGESFHPPKTCTTVSWTFRIFYEKALLEYEKHKGQNGELQLGSPPHQSTSVEKEPSSYQASGSGSGRARRDAAARAMQGWHSRLLGYGEATDLISMENFGTRREKPLKSIGSGLHKLKTSYLDRAEKPAYMDVDKELDAEALDVGPPADWVKISVRESVRVQSDPAGRVVITGQLEQLDNPWGITPFKKVVSLPQKIDPRQTSAVVSLHGRLYVRVHLEEASACYLKQ